MSALPQYAPFEISKAVSAHSIALGFIKNTDSEFEFVGPFAAEIEKYPFRPNEILNSIGDLLD